MKKYKHLSLEEREFLFLYRNKGLSYRKIGEKLGRSHSTLAREYKRNAPHYKTYIPARAHRRHLERGRKQRLKAPLKSPEILLFVREKLRDKQWSPETIATKLFEETGLCIHHETIYRYIYKRENVKYQLWKYLTYKRRRRRKWQGRNTKRDSRIVNAVRISERSQVVEGRNEYGHWETDLMLGTRGSKQALQVNIERKTRFIKIVKLPNKKSKSNARNMVRVLKRYKPKTITSDNGLENAKHEYVAQKLNVKHYFCNPYSSWEKGSVENRIGVIRRYIPKGTDLENYSHKQIRELERELNNRPMKCLNYKTPAQAMRKEGFMV